MRRSGRWLLLVVIVLLGAARLSGQGLLKTAYHPRFNKGTIRAFIKDIERQTQISVSFSESSVNVRKKAQLAGNEQTIQDVLNRILAGIAVKIVEGSDKILIVPAAESSGSPIPSGTITVNGYVKDSSTREVLIGAVVYIPALNTGTTTNSYGFYSLTMPAARYNLVAGYTGYRQELISISEPVNKHIDILLSSGSQLEQVKVTAEKQQSADHVHLTALDVNKYAALLGEPDLMRSLQHMAGVQSAQDGSTSLLVRGGDPGENLNLLDGVPLYYTDHFFGILSIYNTDALKTVDFYKGAFPARYGGRLSSVIDINTRDGNMERLGGQFNLGLLNGSLSLEGPIVKEKASFAITARRSWIDLIWRPVTNTVKVDFYDVNAKANYIVNKSNRLYISVYNGGDQFAIKEDATDLLARWTNTFIAAKWTTILSPKIFINTTATYSRFKFQLHDQLYSNAPDSAGVYSLYTGTSAVSESSIKLQAYWYPSPRHHIEFGVRYANSTFDPASVVYENKPTTDIAAERFNTDEVVLYAEDEIKSGTKWTFRPGLHWATWFSQGFTYASFQPRLFIAYRPSAVGTIYASVTQMAQFLHLLTNNTSGFPTDFWLPSTGRLKPESSTLASLGYTGKLKTGTTYTAEVYYKQQDGLLAYSGGRNVFSNSLRWEDRLVQGRGWGYGLELSARKKINNLVLSAAYTLSWSWRQYDRLNGGERFPCRYDRRHNLKLDANYALSKGVNTSLNWTYMSGEAITLPDQVYPDFDNNLLNSYANAGFSYNYNQWNNYRLPAIHRLDVSVNFVKKKGKYYERIWTLGLYNAYGRRNLVGVNFGQDENGNYRLEGTSIARFIPAISYRLKF